MGTTFHGELDGSGLRVAVAVSRFNEDVTSRLLSGALAALSRHGVSEGDVDIAWVPGAFELPLAAKKLAEGRRYDTIVCLGAVIRGETPHFDYVAGEAARGVGTVALEYGLPVAFGVITPDTMEQALARAGGTKADKGAEAVETAIEMATLLRRLRPD